jgi:hypothetical protein
MHRTPFETVPSGASLNHTLWSLYADDVDPNQVGRQWLERTAWATRRALDFVDAHAESGDCARRYRDAPPSPAPSGAHPAAIGLGPTEARGAMPRWLAVDTRGRTATSLCAETFGLRKQTIRAARGILSRTSGAGERPWAPPLSAPPARW